MYKCLIIALLLISLPLEIIYAANQEAQDACIAQFTTQCMSKCEKSNDVNCTQECQNNAINQCREAGE